VLLRLQRLFHLQHHLPDGGQRREQQDSAALLSQ
jgi:hypothetical protein